MRPTVLRLAFAGLVALLATSGRADAQDLSWAPAPTPAGHPGDPGRLYPFFSAARDLAVEGYIEEEIFVSGRALPLSTAYGSRPGQIAIATGPAKPFKTRVLVRRPERAERFNGVVVIEWFNNSNGFDADNVWLALQDHLVASGYAWVGVSAQGFGGVDTLRAWSPTRYGGLGIEHGGGMTKEPLALDIFRQVAIDVRSRVGLLGVLKPTTVIATGQSQSAIWLSGFINSGLANQPIVDGFLLVSATGAKVDPATPTPVLRIVAEGDAASSDSEDQPDDTALFRQWEIAGSSHVDRHLRAAREPVQLRDMGASVQAEIAPKCITAAIGTATPAYMVEAAGLDRLVTWARGGSPVPTAPRLSRQLDVEGRLQRDPEGLALGGIRLPDIAAPVGTNVGRNSGAAACGSQGYYLPFDIATLRSRYKSPAAYRRAVANSVQNNIKAGFLLPADGDVILQAARKASW
ncbi:MAG: alpha/beta hydrolase domain-containing protein [bacterium]|nr:alpha/beta hydrolase domain-containing protein [bacterium]